MSTEKVPTHFHPPSQELLLCPVTAIAFASAESGVPYFFVGEGPTLKIYLLNSQSRLLSKFQAFQTESIHGISVEWYPSVPNDQKPPYLRCILWGGQSVRILDLRSTGRINPDASECVPVGDELRVDDWILHSALAPKQHGIQNLNPPFILASLVTAHNELHLIVAVHEGDSLRTLSISYARSSQIMLYSAQCNWIVPDKITVVVGTVWGEVQIWDLKISLYDIMHKVERQQECVRLKSAATIVLSPENPTTEPRPEKVPKRFVHQHAGSVFGVHLREIAGIQLVASCSDDRTIKCRSVFPSTTSSESSAHNNPDPVIGFQSRQSQLRQVVRDAIEFSGHQSRIWAVEVFPTSEREIAVLSFGEDCAVCLWEIGARHSSEAKRSFRRHIGKNIWSKDTRLQGLSVDIATGGADGRVVVQSLALHGRELSSEPLEVPSGEYIQPNVSGNGLAAWSANEHPVIRLSSKATISYMSAFQEDGAKSNKPRAKDDSIRAYVLASAGSVVATTRNGHVLWGTIISPGDVSKGRFLDGRYHQVNWHEHRFLPALAGSSIVTRIKEHGVLVASDTRVFAWTKAKEQLLTVLQLSNGSPRIQKIFDIATQVKGSKHVVSALITCRNIQSSSGTALILRWAPNATSLPLVTLLLPTPDEVTAVRLVFDLNILVLGTRSGGLLFFRWHQNSTAEFLKPFYHMSNLHGKNSITEILDLGSNSDFSRSGKPTIQHADGSASQQPGSSYLLTIGRDGEVQIHFVRESHFDPERNGAEQYAPVANVHQVKLPFGPNIEGASFERESNALVIWGFQGTDFVVYDYCQDMITMRVACGGSHRGWDFVLHPSGSPVGHFIWTQASYGYIYAQDDPSHQVVQSGSHGREIKAMAIQNWLAARRHLVATGSEDTNVRIAEYGDNAELRTLCIIPKHTSGICHLMWSEDGEYLFSAGGSEQLLVWHIQSVPIIGIGVVLVAECPKVSRDRDLRITSFIAKQMRVGSRFLVTAVYSDSTLRVWIVNLDLPAESRFKLIAQATEIILLTASTDGHLALWSIPTSEADPQEVTCLITHRLHQSSVKSLQVADQIYPNGPMIVATGGDDNAVVFTLLQPPMPSARPSSWRLRSTVLPKAHAAAVTAVMWLPPGDVCWPAHRAHRRVLISVSNDQTIRLWEISAEPSRDEALPFLHIRKASKHPFRTDIADVSSIDLLEGPQRSKLVVAGIGVEVWDVRKLTRHADELD